MIKKINTLKTVNNPKSIHGMFPYRGKMSSLDVNNILNKLKIFNKVILDPFCGSGTILIESSKYNKKIIGTDSNPIASILCQAKIKVQSLNCEIKNFESIRSRININKKIIIPKSILENFHKKTAIEIISYSKYFKEMSAYNRGCFMGAVALSARACNHYKWTSNIVGKKIKPFQYVNFEDKFKNKILKHHFIPKKNIRIFNLDSRSLSKKIKKNSIDVVITSPPYFDSLDYTSYHNKFIIDILGLNKNLIRDQLIQKIKTYKLSMIKVFDEINKVTKKGAKIIFFVGDKKIKNGKLLKGSDFFISISPFKKYSLVERNYTGTSSQVIDKINKTNRKEQIIIWNK